MLMHAHRVRPFYDTFAHLPLLGESQIPGQRARPFLFSQFACLLECGYSCLLLCVTRLLMSGYCSIVSDTPSQDLRALVGKCFALSPMLLSTGSAHSDMDGASYDASSRFLCASYMFYLSHRSL